MKVNTHGIYHTLIILSIWNLNKIAIEKTYFQGEKMEQYYLIDEWIGGCTRIIWNFHMKVWSNICIKCMQQIHQSNIWDIKYPQFPQNVEKWSGCKRFCKDIRNLIFTSNILKYNIPFFNMVIYLNMFSARMLLDEGNLSRGGE